MFMGVRLLFILGPFVPVFVFLFIFSFGGSFIHYMWAPIHLNPNVYQFLSAWYILYHKLGLCELSILKLRHIYIMKSHLALGYANKNYGVFYLSHMKDINLIMGTTTSNKHWRKRWLWVDGVWQSPNDVYLVDASKKVFNLLQGRIKWGDVQLTS